MDLDESELIWSFFHQIRRVGWSIAHDQKKILLPKVVMDSGPNTTVTQSEKRLLVT